MTKPGRLLRPAHISREDVQAQPDALFVFGDNMRRVGLGGQAAHMRSEPNTVGVPTKHQPNMGKGAFFTDADADNPDVFGAISHAFWRMNYALVNGADVYIPAAGLGTGLAQLPKRAPRVYALITDGIAELERIARR